MFDHERKDGAIAAWQELNRQVAADIRDGVGEIKAAKQIHKRPHPLKTLIGRMAARVLRGEFKDRKQA